MCPNDICNYKRFCSALYWYKDYEKLEYLCKRALKIFKDKKFFIFYLCLLSIKTNNLENAIKYKNVAEILNKNKKIEYRDLFILKGFVNMAQEKYYEAYENFNKASKIKKAPFIKIKQGICASYLHKTNYEAFKKHSSLIKEGIKLGLKELGRDDIPKSLFIYRPITENTISAIINSYITFSVASDFNDPLDTKYIIDSTQEDAYKSELSKIRIRCFAGGEELKSGTNQPLNTLMWAHYAKNHTGIAIEYDLNDIKEKINKNFYFKKIKYCKTFTQNMEIFGKKNSFKSFFTKDPKWEYENEYRLITTEDELTEKYKLENEVQIKSITFGYKIDPNHKKMIKEIVKSKNISCDFYKIDLENIELSPFKLKCIKDID